MIIEPKVRGFICTNAHPAGCAAHVREQIDYVKAQGPIEGGPREFLLPLVQGRPLWVFFLKSRALKRVPVRQVITTVLPFMRRPAPPGYMLKA